MAKNFRDWFSFEGRCLLCGEKFQIIDGGGGHVRHVMRHVAEGYLDPAYEQVRPHPTGFPNPPWLRRPAEDFSI